jgi:hypothetical protein
MARNPETADDTRHGGADAPDWAVNSDGVDPGQSEQEALAQLDPDKAAIGGPATQTLVAWLTHKADQQEGNEAQVMERIIAEMLRSESPDEVLTEKMPIHGKEFLDKTFLLHSIEVREGEFEEGSPFYAIMNVTLGGEDEPRVISCGGWRVLAQLMALDAHGEFPQLMCLRGKRTKKGFTTLRLERPV